MVRRRRASASASPTLTVVFLEGSGGWCAPMLERFDHHVDVFGSRYQTTPPSEVFKRQCYISFDPDEEALAYTANSKYVGADRIVWASRLPAPRDHDRRRGPSSSRFAVDDRDADELTIVGCSAAHVPRGDSPKSTACVGSPTWRYSTSAPAS